jgi:peptidoglycan/LPS O-acetylase OafA/YrhL
MVRFFSSRVKSNLLFTFSILMIVGIASIPTGQWVILKDSVFQSLPPEAGWVYECLHRELFCAATAAIILASIYAEGWIDPIKRFLGHRWFYPVAQVSYSAYLLHEMFMFWLFPRINSAFGSQLSEVSLAILNGFIVLVITLAGAAVMFLWIEEPFLRRRTAKTKGLTK